MQIVSVNVGKVGTLFWEGRGIRTGFRKRSILGRAQFAGANLHGDDQADRTVHGGHRKSVYVYPSEHYAFWRRELGVMDLGWGAFGENLTTREWLEPTVHIGDVVKIGTARFEVTQPRRPCYKMNAAFGRNDMVERFHRSQRSGFYLAPVAEGSVGEGDQIELVFRPKNMPSVLELISVAQPAME